MVHRLGLFLGRIDPGLEHFEDENIVLGRQPHIDDLALEIGITLLDERRLDAGRGHRRQAKLLELVSPRPDVLPQPTTSAANSTVGMLMTHSLAAFTRLNE